MRCYARPSSNRLWSKKFTNVLHGWASKMTTGGVSSGPVLWLFTNMECCGLSRQRDDMEMHAGVHAEIDEPVTD